MPVGDVLVSNAGCHVEHNDAALAIDVVAITEAAKLLLPSSIPNVKLDLAQVLHPKIVNNCPSSLLKIGESHRSESERVDLYTKRCNVLLLELASDVAFNEGGLRVLSVLRRHVKA
jgi:hypothetical protein